MNNMIMDLFSLAIIGSFAYIVIYSFISERKQAIIWCVFFAILSIIFVLGIVASIITLVVDSDASLLHQLAVMIVTGSISVFMAWKSILYYKKNTKNNP